MDHLSLVAIGSPTWTAASLAFRLSKQVEHILITCSWEGLTIDSQQKGHHLPGTVPLRCPFPRSHSLSSRPFPAQKKIFLLFCPAFAFSLFRSIRTNTSYCSLIILTSKNITIPDQKTTNLKSEKSSLSLVRSRAKNRNLCTLLIGEGACCRL